MSVSGEILLSVDNPRSNPLNHLLHVNRTSDSCKCDIASQDREEVGGHDALVAPGLPPSFLPRSAQRTSRRAFVCRGGAVAEIAGAGFTAATPRSKKEGRWSSPSSI